MTDTSSSDLMLAILAMDAYNRGYNSSIDLGGIKKIGFATAESDSSDKLSLEETQKVGFYAVCYNLGGKSVISYRGTDNQGIFAKPDKGASDIWSGWSIGAGYANASQATWAKKFYEAVTGYSVYADVAPSNVVLTGHSLGGGLAGHVAALARTSALAFDGDGSVRHRFYGRSIRFRARVGRAAAGRRKCGRGVTEPCAGLRNALSAGPHTGSSRTCTSRGRAV